MSGKPAPPAARLPTGYTKGGVPEAIIGQLNPARTINLFRLKQMTQLQESFRRLRQSGDYKEALRPLLQAKLVVAGASLPQYNRPVFYTRISDITGAPCITASELAECITGEAGVTPMQYTGLDLIFGMDVKHDLLITWPDSSEYMEAEQVEWFRETVRRNPFLRHENNVIAVVSGYDRAHAGHHGPRY